MSEWQTVILADLVSRITYGFTNPMPTTDSGPYMVTAKDIHDGRIDYSSARFTSRDAYESLLTDKSRPNVGDVLLTKDGSIGRVALVDRPDVCINQSVALLQPNENVDSRFLAYLLQAPTYQERMAADADGSTIKHIYITRVDKMPVRVPSLPCQRAIAALLVALDDKIDANNVLLQLMQDLLAARFEALSVDAQPDVDRSIRLDQLIELNPSTHVRAGDLAPYLDMKCLPQGPMTVSDWSERPAQGGARFKNGDTLLARITPCLENGKVGLVDFLPEGEVGVGSTEFIVMRPRPGTPWAFPYVLARSSRFREYAIRHMAGTTGRQRLAASDLSSYSLRRPDSSDMKSFTALSETLLPKIRGVVVESQRLAAIRDQLLPLLVSGKVRVRDAAKVIEGAA